MLKERQLYQKNINNSKKILTYGRTCGIILQSNLDKVLDAMTGNAVIVISIIINAIIIVPIIRKDINSVGCRAQK